ncbi:MAG: hypothetical protein L0I93_03325 [Atopostipes suicloacalis]|nr:hypothetical protein [Atopostipes suicloacalis]
MKKYASRAMKLNPIVLIIYIVFCYYVAELAEYGGVARRLPIIAIAGGLLLLWILFVIFGKTPKISIASLTKYAKTYYYFAILTLIVVSSFTAYDVYQSSIPFQGKLSWVIEDLKSTRKVDFKRNNVFEYGVEGILQDIQEEIDMPKELFISNEFSISFNKEGTITSIYSSIYGENEEYETETFLVSYDADEEDQISVLLDGYDDSTNPPEEMRLDPLVDAMNTIPIEKVISEWESEKFDVYYIGERDWGYNTDGIYYYNNKELLGKADNAHEKIKGYTTSIYLENDPTVTPKRFVYTESESLQGAMGTPADLDNLPPKKRPLLVDEEFQLDNEIGYQLVVLDAALGSRFYGLTKRTEVDGEYELINNDPFNGSSGGAAGLTFIDESLGFSALSHSGGVYADLYRTIDGGQSFEKIEIPEVEVSLNDTESYNPFDFPEMPFKEEDHLVMYVNQGADGDYKRGVRAIYHSYDDGLTWEFIGEE